MKCSHHGLAFGATEHRIRSGTSRHKRSSVGFITGTFGFRVSVHTAPKKRNASSSKPRREPSVPNSASGYSASSQPMAHPSLDLHCRFLAPSKRPGGSVEIARL